MRLEIALPPATMELPRGSASPWFTRIAALLLVGSVAFAFYQVREDMFGRREDAPLLAKREREDRSGAAEPSAPGRPPESTASIPLQTSERAAASEDARVPESEGRSLGARQLDGDLAAPAPAPRAARGVESAPAADDGYAKNKSADAATAHDRERDREGLDAATAASEAREPKTAEGLAADLERGRWDEFGAGERAGGEARGAGSEETAEIPALSAAFAFVADPAAHPAPEGARILAITLEAADPRSLAALQRSLALLAIGADPRTLEQELRPISAVAFGPPAAGDAPQAAAREQAPDAAAGAFDARLTEGEFAARSIWAAERALRDTKLGRRRGEIAKEESPASGAKLDEGAAPEARGEPETSVRDLAEKKRAKTKGEAQATVPVRIIILRKQTP